MQKMLKLTIKSKISIYNNRHVLYIVYTNLLKNKNHRVILTVAPEYTGNAKDRQVRKFIYEFFMLVFFLLRENKKPICLRWEKSDGLTAFLQRL